MKAQLVLVLFSACAINLIASTHLNGTRPLLPGRPCGNGTRNVSEDLLKPKLDSPNYEGTVRQERNAGKVNAGIKKQTFGSFTLTVRGQFPWQVGITVNKGIYFCSGSLINWNWVTSSAFCPGFGSNLTLGFGALNTAVFEPNRMEMDVSPNAVTIHPSYDPDTLANNIALIKLPFPAPLPSSSFLTLPPAATTFINSVLLPKRIDAINTLIGKVAIVSGWGQNALTNFGGILNWLNSTIISNLECARQYNGSLITGGVICLANNFPDELQAALCQGDSGSPLVTQNIDGTYTLQGIESFGPEGGCTADGPLVFTRVSNYLNWISKTTGIFTP